MLLPLCLLALAFSLTAAAPGGVHRIEAVHRPIARESPKHQQRLERMRASTSGQVPVVDYYFYELLVNVNLGTPAQSFLAELDPYTSDWWVIGADAPFVDQDGERVKSRFNAR